MLEALTTSIADTILNQTSINVAGASGHCCYCEHLCYRSDRHIGLLFTSQGTRLDDVQKSECSSVEVDSCARLWLWHLRKPGITTHCMQAVGTCNIYFALHHHTHRPPLTRTVTEQRLSIFSHHRARAGGRKLPSTLSRVPFAAGTSASVHCAVTVNSRLYLCTSSQPSPPKHLLVMGMHTVVMHATHSVWHSQRSRLRACHCSPG